MKSIKTAYTERKLTRGFVDELLIIAEERAKIEGTAHKTLTRHKYALNASVEALGVARSKLPRPGVWVSLYSKEGTTSTVISNMKFIASILEWASEREYKDAVFYAGVAHAIRQALAVRG